MNDTYEVRRDLRPCTEGSWCCIVRRANGRIKYFRLCRKREHAEEAGDAFVRGVVLR